MTDVFAQAAADLIGIVKSHGGVAITYARPGTSLSVSLTAGKGQRDTEQLDEQGVSERVERRDWLIAAADLVDGSTPIVPDHKDTITDAAGYVYQVVGLSSNDPVWEWSDRSHVILRVHSQEVGRP